jgi:hypothetical protein
VKSVPWPDLRHWLDNAVTTYRDRQSAPEGQSIIITWPLATWHLTAATSSHSDKQAGYSATVHTDHRRTKNQTCWQRYGKILTQEDLSWCNGPRAEQDTLKKQQTGPRRTDKGSTQAEEQHEHATTSRNNITGSTEMALHSWKPNMRNYRIPLRHEITIQK